MAKLVTKTFDNLYEYREFAEKCAKEENYSIVRRVKREAGKNDFYGNLKFEDTIEAMKYGIKDYTSYFLENIADTTNEEDGYDIDIRFGDKYNFEISSDTIYIGICELNDYNLNFIFDNFYKYRDTLKDFIAKEYYMPDVDINVRIVMIDEDGTKETYEIRGENG